MLRFLLAVGSGLAIWLAFPGPAIWPLAVLGVALLALATRDGGPWRGAGLGMIAGLCSFLPMLRWSGTYVGVLPWAALSVTESLYLALLGLASALLQGSSFMGRPRWVRPVAVAALWVGQEWLRGTVPFGGFPWGRLAFSQADSPLLHLAAWAGAPGVTFGVALCGGLLAAGLAPLLDAARSTSAPTGRRHRPRSVVAYAVAGVVAAAVVLFAPGLIPTPTNGPKAQILAVQGNVPQAGLDFNAQRRAVLDDHATATRAAIVAIRKGYREQPDLTVWPENSSDIDPILNPDAAAEIKSVVEMLGTPLVVGAVLQQPAPNVSNVSLLYEPGKGIVDRYVKLHPVPFAEYIPYRSFFRHFSDKVDLVPADFIAGHHTVVFHVPSAHAGEINAAPVICFEVAYDGIVRNAVDDGANLLLVQTNNATFGYTAESAQQLEISQLRAVEHGRSVVHISTVGVSALITPDGVAHQESSLFTTDLLQAGLPLRTETTLADHVGPWPERAATWIGALLVLVEIGRRSRARRAARRAGPPAS